MIRAAYYSNGQWRTARVVHRCDWRVGTIRCFHQIQPGERYYDTAKLNPHSSNPHGTYRICDRCANEKIL